MFIKEQCAKNHFESSSKNNVSKMVLEEWFKVFI
jgi:hypothetical protein